MRKIHLLPADERALFFNEAFNETKIPFNMIEKDYWVVWTLERLFALDDLKDHLTFKGGTSLSKVYGIIERFSEDIDVSIEREFLGFGDDKNPEKAPSRNKRHAMLEALSKACADYVQNKMAVDLRKGIAEVLGTTKGWQLVVDTTDPDAQTLNFEYPSLSPKDGYIRPFVKIEMGARSEHWPVSQHKIRSYVKDALKEKVHEDEVVVRVLNAERTFWEKATILHQYAHLPETKEMPLRISRHFYDFFRLLNSDIKKKALSDVTLLERVASNKAIYFASGWASYATARKGTLKLSPLPRILGDLERDYYLMKQMFFGEIPDWQLILKTIEQFETDFNLEAAHR
ncbi:MAG: hypothetical protein A2583_15915 [Bdellovibrionales bacterium RIFOXYD1_FULL_53_11]|nr:MAG: hypothetical protein A2583_15915 [Bdellovibrionales bacterium RIFOXYD1_FULL_53_11]